MKISINRADPVLTKIIKPDSQVYKVKHWLVLGSYLEDENGCECKSLMYTVIVPFHELEISMSELTKLIEIEICNQNQAQV
jgi:hypothetical protein